jgi:hypothetical protein
MLQTHDLERIDEDSQPVADAVVQETQRQDDKSYRAALSLFS